MTRLNPLSRFQSSHHIWFSELSGSHGILLTRGLCQAWLCDPLLGWLAWCWAVRVASATEVGRSLAVPTAIDWQSTVTATATATAGCRSTAVFTAVCSTNSELCGKLAVVRCFAFQTKSKEFCQAVLGSICSCIKVTFSTACQVRQTFPCDA